MGKLTLSFNSDGHREQTFSHTNRYIMYWWGAQEKSSMCLKFDVSFSFHCFCLRQHSWRRTASTTQQNTEWSRLEENPTVSSLLHTPHTGVPVRCAAELQHCHFFWLSFPHFKQQLRKAEEKISYMKIIWMAVGWESAAALNKFNVDKARHYQAGMIKDHICKFFQIKIFSDYFIS